MGYTPKKCVIVMHAWRIFLTELQNFVRCAQQHMTVLQCSLWVALINKLVFLLLHGLIDKLQTADI